MLTSLDEIFDMDRLLKLTFLLLCPVEIYGDLLKTECFSCLELCITMRKLLADAKGTYTKSFVSTYKWKQILSKALHFPFAVNITMRKLLLDAKVSRFYTKSCMVNQRSHQFYFLVLIRKIIFGLKQELSSCNSVCVERNDLTSTLPFFKDIFLYVC